MDLLLSGVELKKLNNGRAANLHLRNPLMCFLWWRFPRIKLIRRSILNTIVSFRVVLPCRVVIVATRWTHTIFCGDLFKHHQNMVIPLSFPKMSFPLSLPTRVNNIELFWRKLSIKHRPQWHFASVFGGHGRSDEGQPQRIIYLKRGRMSRGQCGRAEEEE